MDQQWNIEHLRTLLYALNSICHKSDFRNIHGYDTSKYTIFKNILNVLNLRPCMWLHVQSSAIEK